MPSQPPVKKAFGALRRACRGKAPPSANADRSAAQKPHWGFRCYAALRKRGRSKREIKNNYSAEDAQSATTTTAASGGNREELLGQRPARRKCRPRHDADAGCRNPISGGHSQSFSEHKKARRALRTAGFGLQFTLPWSRALPQPWPPALLRGQQRERRASPRASGDWGRPSAGTG